MTLLQGYRVMFSFLDTYYFKKQSAELGALLGTMSLLQDNTPADAAYEEDWKIAVSEVLEKKGKTTLSPETAYLAMITFLRNWAEIGSDGTISGLYVSLEKSDSNSNEWSAALNSVLSGKDDPYLHLKSKR